MHEYRHPSRIPIFLTHAGHLHILSPAGRKMRIDHNNNRTPIVGETTGTAGKYRERLEGMGKR
jgi:hypothetical protein